MKRKLIILPLLAALTVGLSACFCSPRNLYAVWNKSSGKWDLYNTADKIPSNVPNPKPKPPQPEPDTPPNFRGPEPEIQINPVINTEIETVIPTIPPTTIPIGSFT